MSTLGELMVSKMADDETILHTEFSHIPDWYEYERAHVKKEIENGTYHIELTVEVDALPNAKRYIRLGLAQLTHSSSGFTLSGNF